MEKFTPKNELEFEKNVPLAPEKVRELGSFENFNLIRVMTKFATSTFHI